MLSGYAYAARRSTFYLTTAALGSILAGMSYESAPSTAFIATHCACCSRPLRDAKSVEIGIGPVCRERYGFDDFGQPNFDQALRDLSAAELASADQSHLARMREAISDQDARKAANLAIHHIAAKPIDLEVPALVAMVRSLGFVRLAQKLAVACCDAQIVITEDGDRIACRSPYSPRFVELARRIPGRRFEKPLNTFPRSSARALLEALRASYAPGSMVVGPTRIFQL